MKNVAPGIPIHAQKYKKALLYQPSLLTAQCVSAIIPLLICNAFAPVFLLMLYISESRIRFSVVRDAER